MDSSVGGAGVILVLPDQRLVMQRRDHKAPSNPDKLGVFGGHIKLGETAVHAVKRELREETSLNVDELIFEELFTLHVPGESPTLPNMFVTLYKVQIESDDFKVYEGAGQETYSFTELSSREDMDHYVKHIIEELKKEKYGFKYN